MQFIDVEMGFVAQHEPPGAEELRSYAEDGRSWVATDATGRRIGYVIAEEVDGCAHIEQVSVEPDSQGKGVGKALIAAVEMWGAAGGLRALTLTTFIEVPWNMPLYEHLGFRAVPERGLDPQTRVCMLRTLV
jgi:GNAT superfamily N-acetyltransferase